MSTEALLSLLPESSAQVFRTTFEQMEIAEKEIARAQKRNPARAAYLNKEGFLLCMPSLALLQADGWIFRAHCREILERLADDRDTRKATSAELTVLFSETSLKAPLTPSGSGLYARHFLHASQLVGNRIEPYFVAKLRELVDRIDPALSDSLEYDAAHQLEQKDRKPKRTFRQFQRRAVS